MFMLLLSRRAAPVPANSSMEAAAISVFLVRADAVATKQGAPLTLHGQTPEEDGYYIDKLALRI